MGHRPRKTVHKVEIVSSTAFAFAKNPHMYDNVIIHEPDQKDREGRLKERAAKEKQKKHDDIWEKIKAAAKEL